MLETSKGTAMRFSCLYRPGAMKPQIWCRITGMARNSETIIVSFSGVRNGDDTSVAIIVAPAGRYARSGVETKV
ncbi:hypothetical protein D3C84_765190 [compost metagenome]